MPDDFRIEDLESPHGDVVLRVHGVLDAKSVPDLTQECRRVRLAGSGLILNLSGVSFIASSGVGSILAVVEEFAESGLSVRLAAPAPVVYSVLKLLNLHRFLDIDDTEEEAMTRLEAA